MTQHLVPDLTTSAAKDVPTIPDAVVTVYATEADLTAASLSMSPTCARGGSW